MVSQNTSKIIYLTDRSGSETDDTCGMKFWFNRKEGGKGIVPKDEALALMIGRTIHEDMALLGELKDLRQESLQEQIDEILSHLTPEDREIQHHMEILYRRLGWIAAWGLFIEPVLRNTWENVAVESEIVLDRDPLFVATTPDRLLKHKKENFKKYLEFKSTISANNKWLDSWPYAIQLHISLAAVKEEYDDVECPIRYATVAGLMKGSYSTSDNRLMHPYVWAWYNAGADKWGWKYDQCRGDAWQPRPVWESPYSVTEWVLNVGGEAARMQFPMTRPIFYNQQMLDNWVARRVKRESEIRSVEEACRDDKILRSIYFPQVTKNCRPPFGDICPYLPFCWNASLVPSEHPDFVPRTPHHELEIIGMEM